MEETEKADTEKMVSIVKWINDYNRIYGLLTTYTINPAWSYKQSYDDPRIGIRDLNTEKSIADTDCIVVIDCSAYEDYVGGSVEKSNHQYLLENFCDKNAIGCYDMFGAYCYHAFGFNPARISAETWIELQKILERLSNYPSIDDDLLSRIKIELQDTAYDDFIFDDLITAIGKKCPLFSDFLPYIDKEEFNSVLVTTMDRENVYYVIEAGCLVYLDVDRIVNAMSLQDIVLSIAYGIGLDTANLLPDHGTYNHRQDLNDFRKAIIEYKNREEKEEIE